MYFSFSDRVSYADQKCSGFSFSILSIFRVIKFFYFVKFSSQSQFKIETLNDFNNRNN
jgi:hypothetical protein